MIGFIKTFLSILLSMLNFFTFPIFGNYTAKTEPLDTENCRLNFAAISDIHMTDEKLRNFMLGFGLHDMENSDYPLDALVCSGDLTDHGYLEDYEMLKKTFAGYNPAKNIIPLKIITNFCFDCFSFALSRFFNSSGFLNIITIPAKNMGIKRIPIKSQAFKNEKVPAGKNTNKPTKTTPNKNLVIA